MKKTTSFHLEEDILNEIEEYKRRYNLSSRNVAIERMLLERRNLLSIQNILINNLDVENLIEVKNTTIPEKKVEVKCDNSEINNAISDVYDDMPD